MTDACTTLLEQHIKHFVSLKPSASILVLLDENFSQWSGDWTSAQKQQLTIYCNRYDVAAVLENQGFKVYFSDFETDKENICFDAVFYRVSKERLVSHHCLNLAKQHLSKQGSLIISGRKEDGIKTYFDNCKKKLGFSGRLDKHKQAYISELTPSKGLETDATLNTENYQQLRKTADIRILDKHFALISKPGVYGWKKCDPGTSFLIQSLLTPENSTLVTSKHNNTARCLDLGCGSGHLSLALYAFGYRDITATDNNAAALLATQATLEENNIQATVVASNAGDTLEGKFKLILCNPPFHKGFDTSKELTRTFVESCKKHLASDGAAYFVTNVFIGIENVFKTQHLKCSSVTKNKQFKIIKVEH